MRTTRTLPCDGWCRKYLEAPDTGPLLAGRNLLTDDVGAYQAVQDLALILSDDGVPGPLVPGAVLREGPHELNLDWRHLPPLRPSLTGVRSG